MRLHSRPTNFLLSIAAINSIRGMTQSVRNDSQSVWLGSRYYGQIQIYGINQLFRQAFYRSRSSTNIIYFSAYRNCKAHAGSCPLHANSDRVAVCLCRSNDFFYFTAQSSRALFLYGFLFSALCRCQGSCRLKPLYLTIMVQTSASQQYSSSLSLKRFYFIFFHNGHAWCTHASLPSQDYQEEPIELD